MTATIQSKPRSDIKPSVSKAKNAKKWHNSTHFNASITLSEEIGLKEVVFCPRKLTIKRPSFDSNRITKVHNRRISIPYNEELTGTYNVYEIDGDGWQLERVNL